MDNTKTEKIETARKVWKLYLLGRSQSEIARKLPIHRSEISAIIKFTTEDMFLDIQAKDTILKAYKKDREEITEKAQSIINQQGNQIKELEEKLRIYESSKISLFGKNIL